MTRKDYQRIAEILDCVRRGAERHGDYILRCTTPHFIENIACEFAAEDPRFNKEKFLVACGCGPDEEEPLEC